MKRPRLWILMAGITAGVVLHASWPHLIEDAAGEMERLEDLLALRVGLSVADIGAGDGQLSILAARRVGPGGALYATEMDAEGRGALRLAASLEGLDNIEVLEAGDDSTGLPDACCDAIFLRRVYHHIPNPSRFNADLLRSIQPDGRVAIIDFTPGSRWFLPTPAGVPSSRTGHGVSPEAVIAEMTDAGFRLRERLDDWPSRAFCLIFEASKE